ncbi:hypothetical protein BOTBODRAFT_601500 [Botryobasidium botryosum FD-172 SS1]|uniref:Uncharacterized protein n=1 Tax=Botryobasidium botryosum (strain FD-172 SS1) TaxID=930990 RepID=A0A067MZD5_BOTB1|nr:hypothetical protein BOTBODRAFT_601500 [Botryobasidium botryosum FD-172 SS1]
MSARWISWALLHWDVGVRSTSIELVPYDYDHRAEDPDAVGPVAPHRAHTRQSIAESIPMKTARIVYFLLGVSVGLPWFALLTASPFFLTRLEGWRLQPAFVSYLVLVSFISEITVLALASSSAKRFQAVAARGC